MNNTYKNPVLEGADPFVLLHDGVYYLYSTNAPDGFRVFTSTDMGTWTDRGCCLRAEDVQGEWGFWAPEVMVRGGKFYMIYVANEHLGIAVADSPLGPFRQAEKRWLNELNEIDGHFFSDEDGTGHHSFTTSKDGRELVCVYHARPGRDTACPRKTCIDRAEFVPDPDGGEDILRIFGPSTDVQRAFE